MKSIISVQGPLDLQVKRSQFKRTRQSEWRICTLFPAPSPEAKLQLAPTRQETDPLRQPSSDDTFDP